LQEAFSRCPFDTDGDNLQGTHMNTHKLPTSILLLLISFASVNAVLFTPALPAISQFFGVTSSTGSYTITVFLLGYALGQLIYGPIANRFGRKVGLYWGISLQIVSSLLCVLSSPLHSFAFLLIGRFFLALGSGVGLKMTFTLVNECYSPAQASKKISYLMLAFAITPALSVALGGFLVMRFGWESCFIAGAIYGVILLLLVNLLPETVKQLDLNAFSPKHLLAGYSMQFTRKALLTGGLLMGCCTSYIYLFAAIAPYISINLFGYSSEQYGLANLLPPLGLIIGSLTASSLASRKALKKIIAYGLFVSLIGIVFLSFGVALNWPLLWSLFVPIIIVNAGLCFILANASTVALSGTEDKAHGSAVMNFLNMGLATAMVIILGQMTLTKWLLPAGFLILWALMLMFYQIGIKPEKVA
jgi:MFS family permease